MVSGQFRLCQDERTIIYSGDGAGAFCPFPFIHNGSYYDSCTRNHKDGSMALAEHYWCPAPYHVDENNMFQLDGDVGKCLEFAYPEGICNSYLHICLTLKLQSFPLYDYIFSSLGS